MSEFDEIKNEEVDETPAESAEEAVTEDAEATVADEPEEAAEHIEEADDGQTGEASEEPAAESDGERAEGSEETQPDNGAGYKEPEGIKVYTADVGETGGIPHSDTAEKKVKKQGNAGAIIAILAVIAALAIICACCALVVGMMIGKGPVKPADTEPVTSEHGGHGTQDTPKETDKAETSPVTEKTPDTENPGQNAGTDPTASVSTGDSSGKYSMTEVAAMTVDSVVEIRTEQIVTGTFMQQYVAKGAGSGVIVTKDGYIATNNHVIDGATSITVVLRNGKIYEATLIGTDSVTDVAIVKINADDLKPATFGSSEKLVVAESVIAIGNPLGSLGGSVTDGIISALARTVTIDDQEMTLMQTTAAINPGNSGGGLFNMSGECIGIVNAKSSGEDIEGIGFAIPSDTAVPIIEDLIRYGYVRGRVMLGVTMLEVNDSYTARRYGLTEFGVYIASVGSGSDAEKAGIKEKDRIVSINGKEITAYSEVKRMIQKFRAGETAEIVVKRDGETVTLSITFSEYKPK